MGGIRKGAACYAPAWDFRSAFANDRLSEQAWDTDPSGNFPHLFGQFGLHLG
jgi:hypothetical protein